MKISQMPLSTTPSSDDVLAMLEGGTQNKKITFGAVADWVMNENESDSLNTDNKTLVGAINELSDKNTELKNDLNNIGDEILVPFSYGRNRINPFESADGYLNASGLPTGEYMDWKTTGFAYVHDCTNVIFSCEYKSNHERVAYPLLYLCTYDNNKNFIEQVYGSTTETTFSVSSSVYYIRCCYHDDTVEKPQIESGTAVTRYEEFNLLLKDSSLSANAQLPVNSYIDNLGRIEDAITNSDFVDITDTFTLSDGYIDNRNGNFVSYNTANSTDYLNIFEYGDVYVSGAAPYSSNCLYAIYDSNYTFLGYRKNGTETNYHFRWMDIIASYPSALYVRFSSINAVAALVIKRPSTLAEVIGELGTKEWTGKKWVCIGDSLTEANSRTTKHYYDYVSEKTGITVVTNAGSGSGYKNPSSVDNKTFCQRAAEIPTDADVVTVFGSGNDLMHGYTLGDVTDTGTTTICGCINTTVDALIARIPTIQLGVVAPTPWASFPPSTADNAMEQYVEALRTICANRSIPFLDLYHCSNLRPWTAEGRAACYTKDDGNGTHPDETGHKLIAPRFKGFLDTLLV